MQDAKLKDDLDSYRKQIDEIDEQLVKLIAQRMQVVGNVAKYKKAHGLPALDEARWQQVLANKQQLAANFGISTELITEIYELIHKEALKLENINLNS